MLPKAMRLARVSSIILLVAIAPSHIGRLASVTMAIDMIFFVWFFNLLMAALYAKNPRWKTPGFYVVVEIVERVANFYFGEVFVLRFRLCLL